MNNRTYIPLFPNGGQSTNKNLLETIKFNLNPNNWGVEDYSDKRDFNAAYSLARKSGNKEFIWNGKRYNSNMEGTPTQQLQWSGITNEQLQNRNFIQDRLSNNLLPQGYNFGKAIEAVVLNKKNSGKTSIERQDAFNLYTGKPQELNNMGNTFSISKYSPSSSKDKNATYYKMNYFLNNDDLVNDYYDVVKNKKTQKEINSNLGNNVTGQYKKGYGKDERGEYISYYDKWDLNPLGLKIPIIDKEITTDFGKPFEIYDRIYVKDYGDGKIKKMYYSDKELSELDVDKNNFNTLELQKELYNRGYKLPKSMKGFSSFDGILGNETKQALEDWKNKNRQNASLENKAYGGEINKYAGGALHRDLQGFKTDLMKAYPSVRFTSEVRPGAKTKQGKPSRHATGEAIDLSYDPKLYNFLWNTTEGTSLLSKYNLGLLDESTPEMLSRTGGTGAHLHVGKDTTIPQGTARHIELMQAQLAEINKKNAQQSSVIPAPQTTEEVKTDEEGEAEIESNDQEYLTADEIMEANKQKQISDMNSILARYNSTNDAWSQIFES